MAYSQLSSSSNSVASEPSTPLSLDGLHRVLLKLENGVEPPRLCVHSCGEAIREDRDREAVLDSPSSHSDMVARSSQSPPCSPNPCRVSVDRPVFHQDNLQDFFSSPTHLSNPPRYDSVGDVPCMSCNPRQKVASLVPAITWLGDYQWKNDLIKDVVSGCTVAVMNIPQGMAYALLGNVPPVVGIYMAIFPVLVYAFLGTSKHVAMGSFAVICLMTGKVVSQYSGGPVAASNSTVLSVTEIPLYSPLEVATAVTFMVAIFQLLMFIFRMGIMCSLLSDTLVNGFTAGAAIHVFTSQIKDLLGMKIPKYNGNFQIIYTYIGIFNNISTINVAATLISIVTIFVLVVDSKFIKPWVGKRSVFPVPIELIAVVLGTLASTFWDIHTKYSLTTVGHISVGLPSFEAPKYELLPSFALDSFIISIIAYIISMSMAFIFAQKLGYEVNPNQELLAQGAGNLVGSFLSCMPFSASLSRSMIQYTVGGRTQLASIICAAILSVVLVSFGPVFEPLPRCILASLIIVALKGVLLQVKDIVKIWHMSALDGIVWICTYLTVIIVEIDIGLLVGLIVSVVTILFRGLRPNIYQLSRLPNTDIYVEKNRYAKEEEINGICIIHYGGGLNFANRGCFKQEVCKIMKKVPKNEKKQLKALHTTNSNKVVPIEVEKEVSFLVLDMTGMQYVDPSGAGAVLTLAQELADCSISVYLAGHSVVVGEVLKRCGVFKVPNIFSFPTVHDAVIYAQSKLPNTVHSIRL